MNIHNYQSTENLAQALASNIAKSNFQSLVLPGGSSPKLLIGALAQQKIDWDGVTLTTTDERVVPLEDPASNAGQVIEIFRENGVQKNPLWLLEHGIEDKIPVVADVTVIGFGLDGHFASLFPRANWENSEKRIFDAQAPFEPRQRKTLSYQYLLASKKLHVLVPDLEKFHLLESGADHLPIKKLIEEAGKKLQCHIVQQ